jgi:hypothetical protein
MGTHAAPTILTNKKTLKFTHLSTAFAKLATEGSKCDENYSIMENHIKKMCCEIV